MAVDSFAAVRFKTTSLFPYFASVLFAIQPIELERENELKTMAIDKRLRLYYNPQMLENSSLDEMVAVLVHEISHFLRKHHQRGQYLDPKIANLAGDCEINDDFKEMGLTLPKIMYEGAEKPADCVYPSTYKLPDGQLMEWYYTKLMEMADKKMPKQDCGSCAAPGLGKKWEKDDDSDILRENEGYSDIMQDFYRKKVAEDIQDTVAKSRGTVPGNLVEWAEQLLKNKVDWRKEVRANISNMINAVVQGLSDYTNQRPSRRQSINKDFFMPSFVMPIPSIAVIVDTSGSVSSEALKQVAAEIDALLKSTNANVFKIDTDYVVHSVDKLNGRSGGNAKKIREFKGRGGTDMCQGYAKIREMKEKPNVIICMTDGETPWPDEALPKTKNLILIVDNPIQEKNCPSWAKVLCVDTK